MQVATHLFILTLFKVPIAAVKRVRQINLAIKSTSVSAYQTLTSTLAYIV